MKAAPEDGYARRNLGALLGERGLNEEAETQLRAAIALLPGDQQSLYGLARLLLALGGQDQTAEADALLQRAVDIDPDSDLAQLCRTDRNKIASTNFRASAGEGTRMDGVLYCLSAMKMFAAMTPEQIAKVTFEVAMLGMKGLDVNEQQKYELRSLPGRFSGLQLVSIMYVGMKIIDPTADTGFDLSKEYEEAKNLSGLAAGS